MPFDPDCQRWLPDVPFPSHRFLPGQSPRPTIDATAAMRGVEIDLSGAEWWRNRPYLAGVDLFNFAYWWEAHEFWELLWRHPDLDARCRRFLRSLIQVAAALLKWHQGNGAGMKKLAAKAGGSLDQVICSSAEPDLMGLHLIDLKARVSNILEASERFESSDARLRRPGLVPVLYLQTACPRPG